MSRAIEPCTCCVAATDGIDITSGDVISSTDFANGSPGTCSDFWQHGHLTSVLCRVGITENHAPQEQVKGIRSGRGESFMDEECLETVNP